MFVFVKFGDSTLLNIFGPATPSECESWMKIKKIYPRNGEYFSGRFLSDAHELNTRAIGEHALSIHSS